MTKFKQMKLKAYGAEGLSANEALALAIEAEEMMKSLNPFDPAFIHFAEMYRRLEKAAYVLSE